MSDYNTAVLSNSPILYAKLDETSGATINDSSATAHNGTLTGSPTYSVSPLIKTDTSITFSGAGQYVEFTTNAAYAFSGSLTVEAWIKTSTGGTMNIVNGDDSTGVRVFQFRLNAGKLEFVNIGGSTKTGSVTVNDNVKHHVVAVYDRSASTVKLYVDGVQDGTTLTGQTMSTSQTPLQIAERLSSGTHTNLFTGTLDEVAVYNTALSAASVLEHYGVGVGAYVETATVRSTTRPSGVDVLYQDSATVKSTTTPSAVLVSGDVDSATVRSVTNPVVATGTDVGPYTDTATVTSTTSLVGSYISETFTIHTRDYNFAPWDVAYSSDGSYAIAGNAGIFDDDDGTIT